MGDEQLSHMAQPAGTSVSAGPADRALRQRRVGVYDYMRSGLAVSIIASGLGVLCTMPAVAQASLAPPWLDLISDHHQLQYQMMKDMTREMNEMTQQLSQGELKGEQRTQLSERLRRMSRMMGRMSGLSSRPAHTHAQLRQQMDDMRKQMKELTSDLSVKSPAK